MSKYLITCYPIAGHLHPNIALAQELVSRGHEVAVYSGDNAKKTLASVELKHFYYHKKMNEIINSVLLPLPSKDTVTSDISTDRFPLLHLKQINKKLQRWFIETIPYQVDDITQIIDEWSPDAIVSDIALFGPTLFLSEMVSIPTAIFCVIPACSIPGPDAPTWGRGLPLPNSFISRLRSLLEKKIKHFALTGFKNELNKMRSRYGLPPIYVPAMEYVRRLPLYMVVGTPELDYSRRDLPKSVHYVGPCLWHRPNNELPPSWISTLSKEQPIIYATEGTIHVKKPFLLEATSAALAGEKLKLIMTTGKHRAPKDIKTDPGSTNIRIEQYVAHGDLFPFVDIVITTGGTGTILSALLLGIPLIVVPTGWDLPENAQRVVEAGVGIRIEPEKCTIKRLRSAVFEILDNPKFRLNAKKIGNALAKRGGPGRGGDLLEKMVKNS
ncbi:nucleotide disphospho-sugar-binding domain-containing protein [Desulfobacula sp.]|uniref:nucleotide disphospho-sugar-binding domain-containing protein n=1 Tax=Desulfobacula sp. TaxID=2593537 RepID=UPI002622D9A2|nr:nucleotide disphospho-sugar-binding domain-containing protein [Desulfobacula sp.]